MSRKPCWQYGKDGHTTNEESLTMFSIQPKSVLPERSDQDLRKFQLDNPLIGFVLRA